MFALSIHGLFEGVALGIQRNPNGTIIMFLAILAHKWAEAFSLVKFINNSEWIHQINHHLTFCLSFDNFPFAKSQSFLLFFLSLVISMLQE